MVKITGSSRRKVGTKIGRSFVESKMRQTLTYGFSAAGASPPTSRALQLLKPRAARTIVNRQCRNPGGNDVQGIARRADNPVSRPRAGRKRISGARGLADQPGNARISAVRHDRRIAGARR